MESADMIASKAIARKGVRVQVPHPALTGGGTSRSRGSPSPYYIRPRPLSQRSAVHVHGTEVRQRAIAIAARRREERGSRSAPQSTRRRGRLPAPRGPCEARRVPWPRRLPLLQVHGTPVGGEARARLLRLCPDGGHIARSRPMSAPFPSVWCTGAWPGPIEACGDAVQRVVPGAGLTGVKRTGCHGIVDAPHA